MGPQQIELDPVIKRLILRLSSVLEVKLVALYLDVSESTVRRVCAHYRTTGEVLLPQTRIGRLRLLNELDLDVSRLIQRFILS